MNKAEEQIHKALVDYIDLQYPLLIYRTDGAGLKLPIGQAKKFAAMQKGRAYPDLFIAEARHAFHGFYLEIKAGRGEVYKKNGDLRDSKHIVEQRAMLSALNSRGYFAAFGMGIDHCKDLVDEYMKLPVAK